MKKQPDELPETVTYIALNSSLATDLLATLKEVNKQLALSADREAALRSEVERTRLMDEAETMAYLKRDADTVRYYHQRGLPYIKKSGSVWHTKGDIDDWLNSGKVSRQSR